MVFEGKNGTLPLDGGGEKQDCIGRRMVLKKFGIGVEINGVFGANVKSIRHPSKG